MSALPKQEIVAQPLPATASEQAAAMLQVIKEVATSPNVNVEAIRVIMDMQRQLTQDQAERSLNEALARLAPKLPRIKRNGSVEYAIDKNKPDGPKKEAFKFAKWEDIDKGIRPLLAEEGLALSYTTKPRTADGGGTIIIGRVSHIQGAFREAEFAAALDSSGGKNNIQAMKSSFRYGQRAVTEMLLNIVTEGEDDDGVSAGFITIEQAAEIDLKIRETGADRERFLKWVNAQDVQSIQAKNYQKAINELAKKATAKKGAA